MPGQVFTKETASSTALDRGLSSATRMQMLSHHASSTLELCSPPHVGGKMPHAPSRQSQDMSCTYKHVTLNRLSSARIENRAFICGCALATTQQAAPKATLPYILSWRLASQEGPQQTHNCPFYTVTCSQKQHRDLCTSRPQVSECGRGRGNPQGSRGWKRREGKGVSRFKHAPAEQQQGPHQREGRAVVCAAPAPKRDIPGGGLAHGKGLGGRSVCDQQGQPHKRGCTGQKGRVL